MKVLNCTYGKASHFYGWKKSAKINCMYSNKYKQNNRSENKSDQIDKIK